MLEHGGKLQQAMARFGHAREDWLDLSTGINPQCYSAPNLPDHAWHRLPEFNAALHQAACRYYGVGDLLAVAGSQVAIQSLPRLRSRSRVVIGAPAYAEHAYRWRRARHEVVELPYTELAAAVDTCDVMLLVNPNNPTGDNIDGSVLVQWAARLASRGGWLVVDEAFADVMPEISVTSVRPGLIVLRSIGKFFGLAGLRLGFVIAENGLLAALSDEIGPWGVSEAAQVIGAAALNDLAWQQETFVQLKRGGARLQELLASYGIASRGCALFQWWAEMRAEDFAEHMGRRAILVRRFQNGGIRLGLPGNEQQWQRLTQALDEWFFTEQQ